MNQEIDYKEIAKNIFEEIAIKVGENLFHETPSATRVTTILGMVKSRLNIPWLGKSPTEEQLRNKENFDTVHKALYEPKGEVKESGDWHKKLAYLLYALKFQEKLNQNEIVTRYLAHDYGSHWEQYRHDYTNDAHIRPVDYIKDAFWSRKKISKITELTKNFIGKGDSSSIAKVIANKGLPYSFHEKRLSYREGLADQKNSLKEIISAQNYLDTLIILSSKEHGEGKGTYLWQFMCHYYKELHFLYINDIFASISDFPPKDKLNDGKNIVVVIDAKLKFLDADDFALSRILHHINHLYQDLSICVILSDSEFYLKRKRDQIKDFSFSFFEREINITNFKLDEAENNTVLEFLVALFDLKKNSFEAAQFTRSQYQIPLAYRIAYLLNEAPGYGSEWNLWLNSPEIKEQGLQYLYFITSLTTFFNAKCPIDLSSKFLSGTKENEINELLRSKSEYSSYIKKSSYRLEYPQEYLSISNNFINKYYLIYDRDTHNNAKHFFNDILSIIKSRKAENSHSYIFRKIYKNKSALSSNSPIHDDLRQINIPELFKLLIESPNIDEENRQKCYGELANHYVHIKRYDKASDYLSMVVNQKDDVILFLRARIEFEYGNISHCLNMISSIQNPKRDAYILRQRCFLNLTEIEDGFNYYIQSFSDNLNEFKYCIDTLKWLTDSGEYDIAEKYYEILECFFRGKDYLQLQYGIVLNSMVAYYRNRSRIELKKGLPRNEKFSVQFDEDFFKVTNPVYLEKAVITINKLKTISPDNPKVLITEGYLYFNKRDNDEALRIANFLLSKNPINLAAARLKALVLLHRKGDMSSKVSDYNEAVTLLENCIVIFDHIQPKFESKVPVYLTLARVYLAQGKSEYWRAIKKLEKIISEYNSEKAERPKMYDLCKSLLSYANKINKGR